MKYRLFAAGFLFFLPLLLMAQNQQPVTDSMALRTFRRQDLQEEFRFFRRALEETHPGLYRYTPKAIMTARLDSFYRQIKDNMPFYDYYRLMSALVSNVRCAHTVILPAEDWQGFFMKQTQLFPFGQILIRNRMYITLNQTSDTTIKPGYEIIFINGRPIDAICRTIYQHTWGDGYSESLKRQTFNQGFFSFFYHLYVERTSQFLLTCKDFTGRIVTVKAPGLPMKAIQENMAKNPVNKEILRIYGDNGKKPGRELKLLNDSSIAIMKLKDFGGSGPKGFPAFLENSMKELKEKNIKNLVIDLRNNGGGWDSSGVLLFTYLINKTSRYYVRQHTITDSSEFLRYSDISKEDLATIHEQLKKEPDGTFTLKPQYTPGVSWQNPKPDHYTGKVYFIINGASGSTTSEFIAAAQGNELGVFIGEESGGCHEGGNGGSFLHLVLPTSKIVINTPLVYYGNGGKPAAIKGRGTMPEYDVPDDMDYLLQGRDIQKEFVLKLIMKSK